MEPIVVPPEIDDVFPKLKIHDITHQAPTPAPNHCQQRKYIVENLGKTVACSVYVEMLEANRMTTPQDMAVHPADLYTECFRRDIVGPIVLYPGGYKQVTLTFERKFDVGQSVCICYDPIKDPRKFPMGVGIGAQANRKFSNKSYSYTSADDGTGGWAC